MTEERWVEVLLTAREDEATIVSGYLRNRGIPAVVEHIKFSAEPVAFVTAMAKIRVKVPESLKAEAEKVLEEARDDTDEPLA